MRHLTHELNDVYRKCGEFLTVKTTKVHADSTTYEPKRCTLSPRFFFTGSHYDASINTEKLFIYRLTVCAQHSGGS